MGEIYTLSDNEVIAIQEFVDSKDNLIKNDSFNVLLRDDIFRLLDNQDCIVVYYPLDEDEENNGFHVEHPVKGELKHFVFINTAQYKEKQIFTAAHELGHIWDIIGYMNTNGFTGNEEWKEHVINRFAAELLMPEREFIKYSHKEIMVSKTQRSQEQVSILDVIHIITSIKANEQNPNSNPICERLFDEGIIQTPEMSDVWKNIPDGQVYYEMLVKSIYRGFTGDEYPYKSVLSGWKKQDDFGEVHSAAMYLCMNCDYLLSDDMNVVRHLSSTALRAVQKHINVLNRDKCYEKLVGKGLISRKILNALCHK